MSRAALLLLALLGSRIPSIQQGSPVPVPIEKRGPQVGSVAPPIHLHDQSDHERTLESLAGKQGLVLLFVRSADW